MKLKRLSFLTICVGALVLQACSHAPRPQEGFLGGAGVGGNLPPSG
jgi:hypothetical protein